MRKVDVVLVGVAAVWGSSYLAAKVASESAPVEVVLFLRYGVAAVVCVALLAGFPGRWPDRRELAIGTVLGVTQAAVLALETWGVAGTSASNAGVLISLTILMTPGFESLLGGVRLPPRFRLAALMCVAGVVLLLAGHTWAGPQPGDLLVLAAAVVRAGHVALVGRLSPAGEVRPLAVTSVQLGVGTLLFVPFAVPGLGVAITAGSTFWIAVIHLAVGCSVFAFLAQTWAVQRTSASRASLLLGSEPIWALACAAALGDERITALAGAGAVVIITATYWGQSIESRHRLTTTKEKPCPIPTPT